MSALLEQLIEALRILPPQQYVAATETIDEVVEMVGELLESAETAAELVEALTE